MMATVEHRHHLPNCDRDLTLAFALLGKRWNGVILGALTAGPAGFADIARAIPGISDSMLADRLRELTALPIVARTVCAGPPVTVLYELSVAGQALVPILRDLAAWAQQHLGAATGTVVRTGPTTHCLAGEHSRPEQANNDSQGT